MESKEKRQKSWEESFEGKHRHGSNEGGKNPPFQEGRIEKCS